MNTRSRKGTLSLRSHRVSVRGVGVGHENGFLVNASTIEFLLHGFQASFSIRFDRITFRAVPYRRNGDTSVLLFFDILTHLLDLYDDGLIFLRMPSILLCKVGVRRIDILTRVIDRLIFRIIAIDFETWSIIWSWCLADDSVSLGR